MEPSKLELRIATLEGIVSDVRKALESYGTALDNHDNRLEQLRSDVSTLFYRADLQRGFVDIEAIAKRLEYAVVELRKAKQSQDGIKKSD